MNSKFSDIICFKNLQELNNFTDRIDSYRLQLSFFNFTPNTTHENYNNFVGIDSQQNEIFQIVKLILYGIMIVASFILNLLIIFVIYFHKSMQNSTNYFILNLATCDLTIVCTCAWVKMVSLVRKDWILGETYCKMNSYLQMVSIIVGVLTLAIISCDRFMCIVLDPSSRIPKISKRKCAILIFVIWVTALVIAIPCFVYRAYTGSFFEFNYLISKCMLKGRVRSR
jgi:hypothetical protein